MVRRSTLAPVLALALGLSVLSAAPAAAWEDPVSAELFSAGPVTFVSPTTAELAVDYRCTSADPSHPVSSFMWVGLQQGVPDGQSLAAGTEDNLSVLCDGVRSTVAVTIAYQSGTLPFRERRTNFMAVFMSPDTYLKQEAVVRVPDEPPLPAPKAPVALTVNASPEPVRAKKTIKVKGTLERAGKPYRGTTLLELRRDGGSYVTVATVRSDTKGRLSTTVRATGSGTFRYRYDGSTTTEAGVSAGDHVEVLVKAKRYAGCDDLAAVYPHGVGKPGARDDDGVVHGFTRDAATYRLNKRLDTDRDGTACER